MAYERSSIVSPLSPDLSESRSFRERILQRFERDLNVSETHFAKWRRDCKKWYRTYAGDPWPEGDREHMEQYQGRPAANFNLALGTINAVVGSDLADRKEVRFEGVSTADLYDTTVAQWFTQVARHQFNKCNGHRVQADVFLNGLITGYGFARTFLNMRQFPFRLGTQSLRPWLVYCDPDSWEDGMSDARFIIYREDWNPDDVKENWPKQWRRLSPGYPAMEERGSAEMPRSVNANDYRGPSSVRPEMLDEYNRVRIYEYQFLQLEQYAAFTNQQGRDQQMPLGDFEDQYGDQLDYVIFGKQVRYRAFVAASRNDGDHGILLEAKSMPVDSFTISSYTGLRDVNVSSGRVTRFGLMQVVYEPQLYSAKILSLALEKLATSGKGVHIMETGAVADPDEAKHQLSVPNGILVLNEGALGEGKYRFEKPESVPQFIDRMLSIAQEGIPHTSMVTDWIKGTAHTERSNVLISNLQNQSMVGLSLLTDPMTSFRLHHGLLFTQFAIRYLSPATLDRIIGDVEIPGITHEQDPMTGQVVEGPDGQSVPIMGPDGQPLTPGQILQQEDLFDWDVQVDTGQASPSAKQALWRAMIDTGLLQKMAELAPQIIQDVLPEMLKLSPLPVETTKVLVQKLETALKRPNPEKIMEQIMKLPPDQQAQMAQLLMKTLGGAGNGAGPQPAAQPS